MSISLTAAAADRVQSFLTRRGQGVGLRLSVKKTGCSGFAYVVNYADAVGGEDIVFEDRGVKVVVDRASLGYVDGTEIDFVKQGLNEAFRFRNPNVKGSADAEKALPSRGYGLLGSGRWQQSTERSEQVLAPSGSSPAPSTRQSLS